MNTIDKVINDLAIQLANKTIECANYKALYEDASTTITSTSTERSRSANRKRGTIIYDIHSSK